jgi:hypothetical protein
VPIEQVEEAKLLGITLDGQLSWASDIDNVVVKMCSDTVIKRYSEFFTQKSTTSCTGSGLVPSEFFCKSLWYCFHKYVMHFHNS